MSSCFHSWEGLKSSRLSIPNNNIYFTYLFNALRRYGSDCPLPLYSLNHITQSQLLTLVPTWTRHFTLPKHFSFLSQMMTYLPHSFLDEVTPDSQPRQTQERHTETMLNIVLTIKIPSSNVPALRTVKKIIKRNLNCIGRSVAGTFYTLWQHSPKYKRKDFPFLDRWLSQRKAMTSLFVITCLFSV